MVSLLGYTLGNARISHGEPSGRAPLTRGPGAAVTRSHTCIRAVIILFIVVNVLHCHDTLSLFPQRCNTNSVVCRTVCPPSYAVAQEQQPFTSNVLPLPVRRMEDEHLCCHDAQGGECTGSQGRKGRAKARTWKSSSGTPNSQLLSEAGMDSSGSWK